MRPDTKWLSYMRDEIEYPHPAVEPLRQGVLFSYISSTFLNGWINYVGDVRRAYLVTRYRSHAENVEALAKWHADPPFHSKFDDIPDDVHLIAKDEGGKWWYFWYDRDCSDCCIGILDTDDSDDAVLVAFDEHVNSWHGIGADRHGTENGEEPSPPLAIDPKTIRGWVSG